MLYLVDYALHFAMPRSLTVVRLFLLVGRSFDKIAPIASYFVQPTWQGSWRGHGARPLRGLQFILRAYFDGIKILSKQILTISHKVLINVHLSSP